VLNLLLILSNLLLIVEESLFNFEDVLLVGVDKLSLLALEHGVYFVLEIGGEASEVSHEVLDFLDVVLSKETLTLYL